MGIVVDWVMEDLYHQPYGSEEFGLYSSTSMPVGSPGSL